MFVFAKNQIKYIYSFSKLPKLTFTKVLFARYNPEKSRDPGTKNMPGIVTPDLNARQVKSGQSEVRDRV